MELLDRYVGAVRSFLPKEQQDDIVTELRDNTQSQMDDREAELGRPLTEAEQEAILQQHGHPMIVAGRYRTDQGSLVFGRQLIGPTLFPIYLRTLWYTFGLSLAITLIVFAARVASGGPITFGGALNAIVLQVAIQFGVVTCIFTVAEQSLPTMRWSVQRPPALPSLAQQAPRVPRLESIAQIVAMVVLLFWLWFVFERSSLLLGPAADIYRLGPVWQRVALPILAIFMVFIVQGLVNLVRPDWMGFRSVTRVGLDIAGLIVLVYLVRTDHWVVLAHPNGDGGGSLANINQYVYYALWVVVIGSISVTLIDAWKLIRGRHQRAGDFTVR